MAQRQQGPRIIILGSNGKLGRLVRAVWSAGGGGDVHFVPVVRRASGITDELVWAPGMDLTNLPQADAVVALWGVIPGQGADLAANTALALAAMEVGHAVGADRVFHCSSAAIYAAVSEPLTECVPLVPLSDYGQAKLEMERALLASRRDRGPVPVSLRIGNVAGAESLFAAMSRSQVVHLDRFSDGAGPERSYIAATDLAQVLAKLATLPRQDLPEVLNVAAPVSTSMESIVRAAGRQVVWRDAPAAATRRVILDTARLNALCPLRMENARPEYLVSDWLRWKEAE
ncbi:NAD-dependent epimerase/dehydratase family protein [Puniceibacterium confluentis]|uniref:NAD-dependent epimerase/dehydratase family protein n=1 Tax=Puniceibacterium confluentis TaxID=1958944 RepID=UPI00164707E2|nr:NAD-dependent epimerase/dehydratase family protein [Puniceibacterium confluentis]